MNVSDLIEAYVADVAVQLPRRQRNDVAFELHALLGEELQARAEASGRVVDTTMATDLLRDFGHPDVVAVRYRPVVTIIDPADGYTFLRLTVVGLAIIWGAGLLKEFLQPVEPGSDLILALTRWWYVMVGTVISSLWWPGVLVTWFAISAWVGRRWPSAVEWKPRTRDHVTGGRASMVMGIVGIVLGLFVLIDPRGALELLFGAQLAPVAYDALTYTESFRQLQGPILFVVLLLNIPLMVGVVVSGVWSANLRRLALALEVLVCVVMFWTILDGPVFMTTVSDKFVKVAMSLIIASVLIARGIGLYRRVLPAPDSQVQAHGMR